MDTRALFAGISKKMMVDFELSAHVKHSGSKGSVRENKLREFLCDGRLPGKYGLGSGEVVGRVRDTSHQCDLVIYDKLSGVTLLYDDLVQVYPIDCVYGIVEVKSSLSKAELIDSLEKIKSLKSMFHPDIVRHQMGSGMVVSHARPRPFGFVFAYSLSGNSIDSLCDNLREWESENDPEVWPNFICVLESGVIFHNSGSSPLASCIDSATIDRESWPIAIHYKEDSLFNFYCALHDACSHMNLGAIELRNYYNPSLRVGRYIVSPNAEFNVNGKVAHFTEVALDRVVSWCSSHGAIDYQAAFMMRFGTIPVGMEGSALMRSKVYVFNPDNLPGVHEIGPNPIINGKRGAEFSAPCLGNCLEVVIDGKFYILAMSSFSDDDFEVVS